MYIPVSCSVIISELTYILGKKQIVKRILTYEMEKDLSVLVYMHVSKLKIMN